MPRKPDPDNVFPFTRTTAGTVQLGPGQKERVVWDQATPGFGLRLRAGGSRVWVIRPAPSSGKYGLLTIGSADRLNLNQARAAARDQLAKSQLGEAPREIRQKATMLLGGLFETYITRAENRLKPDNFKDLKRHLNHDFRSLHALPISKVRRGDIVTCLDEITIRGPATANRARSILSTFFVWAIGQDLTDLNPVVGTNKPAKDVRRERVLPDAELFKVWRACGDDDFGRIIKLLMLTGQRRDEVACMPWDELDLDAAMWTLPGERTKNGRVHEVPLSAPVLEILRAQPMREGSRYVFGRGDGPYSGFSRAKARLDEVVQLKQPWVIHDLRRSCSTGMNNIKVLPHVVEAVINHVSGDAKAGVAGVYNWALYREEKREALDLWAKHVLALGKPLLKIVPAHA